METNCDYTKNVVFFAIFFSNRLQTLGRSTIFCLAGTGSCFNKWWWKTKHVVLWLHGSKINRFSMSKVHQKEGFVIHVSMTFDRLLVACLKLCYIITLSQIQLCQFNPTWAQQRHGNPGWKWAKQTLATKVLMKSRSTDFGWKKDQLAKWSPINQTQTERLFGIANVLPKLGNKRVDIVIILKWKEQCQTKPTAATCKRSSLSLSTNFGVRDWCRLQAVAISSERLVLQNPHRVAFINCTSSSQTQLAQSEKSKSFTLHWDFIPVLLLLLHIWPVQDMVFELNFVFKASFQTRELSHEYNMTLAAADAVPCLALLPHVVGEKDGSGLMNKNCGSCPVLSFFSGFFVPVCLATSGRWPDWWAKIAVNSWRHGHFFTALSLKTFLFLYLSLLVYAQHVPLKMRANGFKRGTSGTWAWNTFTKTIKGCLLLCVNRVHPVWRW